MDTVQKRQQKFGQQKDGLESKLLESSFVNGGSYKDYQMFFKPFYGEGESPTVTYCWVAFNYDRMERFERFVNCGSNTNTVHNEGLVYGDFFRTINNKIQ